MASITTDPGKQRSIQRVTSEDGFFNICAMDHQRVLKSMLSNDPDSVEFGDIVQLKDTVVRAVAPEVSGVLTDARYGAAFVVATGALPRNVGSVVEVGDEGYDIPPGPRKSRLRSKWSMKQIKLLGADVAKFLWFFRPDVNPEVAEHQRTVLRELVKESEKYSLPIIVEPIWYPLPGEDASSPEWKDRRIDGIVESAIEADKLGADLLKLEFPGYLGTPEGDRRAVEACQAIDAAVSAPWLILSAGVGFEEFAQQMEIAAKAGSAGYMAGRSVWMDAVTTHDEADRAKKFAAIRDRLSKLNEITRTHGKPVATEEKLDEILGRLPEFWYESWHPDNELS
jgi:tagatose 1,6-diphosphate aldolase